MSLFTWNSSYDFLKMKNMKIPCELATQNALTIPFSFVFHYFTEWKAYIIDFRGFVISKVTHATQFWSWGRISFLFKKAPVHQEKLFCPSSFPWRKILHDYFSSLILMPLLSLDHKLLLFTCSRYSLCPEHPP